MKSRLVCLIGIDGSGKTPHARMLTTNLKHAGVKCKYVWARWRPVALKLPQLIFTRIYPDLSRTDSSNYHHYKKQKQRIVHGQKLYHIWESLVLLDYGVQILLKVRIPLLLGVTIVCDRYVYDTLVDFAADFELSSNEIERLVRNSFLHLFAKPDVVVLLDTPESIAFKRKGKPGLGLMDFLVSRRKTYLDLAPMIHASVIDTSADFLSVHRLIMDAVGKNGVGHG